MKAPMLLALAGLSMSNAQAAEPAGTLTLPCKGTETDKGDAGSSSEQINIGVIVDFQKKAVLGLSGGEPVPVPITSISETTISFEIAVTAAGWVMTGTLDRVTGALVASFAQVRPEHPKNNTVSFVRPAMQANAADVLGHAETEQCCEGSD